MHVTERTARSEMPRIRNQQVGVEARGLILLLEIRR